MNHPVNTTTRTRSSSKVNVKVVEVASTSNKRNPRRAAAAASINSATTTAFSMVGSDSSKVGKPAQRNRNSLHEKTKLKEDSPKGDSTNQDHIMTIEESTVVNNEHTHNQKEHEHAKTNNQRDEIRSSQMKRKSLLRIRNLGVGIGSITVDPNGDDDTVRQNKKIRFDDLNNESFDTLLDPKEEDEENKSQKGQKNQIEEYKSKSTVSAVSGTDDDDMIEEVKISDAKNEALQIRAVERMIIREGTAFLHKKKKNKSKRKIDTITKDAIPWASNDDDESLDDSFFDLVDSELKIEKMLRKKMNQKVNQREHNKKKVNQHTTFALNEDGDVTSSISNPIPVGHNIQLVVLPYQVNNDSTNAIGSERRMLSSSTTSGTEPSTIALHLCRNRIVGANYSEEPQKLNSKVSTGFKSKRGRRNKEETFIRSRKAKYSMRNGLAAANFLVHK